MSKILVRKSGPLKGTVKVSGAKNSVLPIMAASLLAQDTCVLEEIPALRDVEVMSEVLASLGADVKKNADGILEIKSTKVDNFEAPYDLVSKMRASFLVIGPLLARMGRARVSLPGGCAIGARPIDLHLKGLSALGAKINLGHGYVEAIADKLIGDKIYLDFPSVGATENIMMAACFAQGQTIIQNAAEEPEVVDLANFLNSLGANIKGAGTDTIRIQGVKELGGTRHTVIPDRIEAGTYMVAAAITGGDVTIKNALPDHLKPMIAKLKECGVEIEENGEHIRVVASNGIKAVDIKTMPYPGFPTDMQSQFMALLSVAEGTSVVIETVFENRFMHVSELNRMGANIKIEGHSAVVQGVKSLEGAQVRATDLRAGAALILAGLTAEGVTEISDVYHIDRGYVEIEEKLKKLGANIERVE
ncbi:UDP-N-acetylglucosamine 1-carboxyvinyltransferase [Caminicella sporogenes DSM 14501]|uniref:UDP-N-acetylglucosamine 1-carboxyvinyltransferase n=1 Tax=Caminicella sporogenes DSM 14501 TaxID=1121266 RepID=A0A1M6PUD1_9FIRM|nr:UDP-N-acetylglucosamine 1-carboxyvinyltransferase [Caminicella sporogenes]RKD21971.1 UDP-N-acetylglucosamine 1-carboxyvinyltransferase [Caminicella sporogenes]WIF96069.1 UDP-N-acetylglucosamine 1-carboxyvinyltransferase [Caminicella sporogenes]SHK11538.1 UDP-N-acetylglucosamine 1-carboxyvinyltransferase [Caminicella sporogenes DSM 14501]